jgi:hypothetical protein
MYTLGCAWIRSPVDELDAAESHTESHHLLRQGLDVERQSPFPQIEQLIGKDPDNNRIPPSNDPFRLLAHVARHHDLLRQQVSDELLAVCRQQNRHAAQPGATAGVLQDDLALPGRVEQLVLGSKRRRDDVPIDVNAG